MKTLILRMLASKGKKTVFQTEILIKIINSFNESLRQQLPKIFLKHIFGSLNLFRIGEGLREARK